MKTQKNTYQDRQLALAGAVKDCIHEILTKSRNETEARLGLDALQKVVNEVQKSDPQMKTTPILSKIGSLVGAAMKSAKRLSLSDVTMAAKGSVVHINFKGSATVEVTSIDDNMTLFNVEAIRKGDRTRMIHIDGAKVLQLLKDVVRAVDSDAKGSVEKAHDKGFAMEDIDADELLEAVLNRHEERVLLDAFGGDKDAMKHFQDVKSGKHKNVPPQSKQVVTEHTKPETNLLTNAAFERMRFVAGVKATVMTEAEKAKKAALEKGETIFVPQIGFDGRLRFVGEFRKMENRHV